MLVAVFYNCFSVIVCFQHKSGRCFSHLNMLNWFTFCHVQDIHSLIKRNVQFMVENHALNYRCFKTHHFGLFYRISLFIVIYSITWFTQFANRTCCPIQIINITLPWISEKKYNLFDSNIKIQRSSRLTDMEMFAYRDRIFLRVCQITHQR